MNIYGLLAWQFGGGSGLLGIAPLIFIFAIFYFVLIMPQQRKQKKWQAMLGELKTGDKDAISGGLRGTIVAVKDDYVYLCVTADNVRVGVKRSAIASETSAVEAL